MRSSGTACFLPIMVALLLAPAASGSPPQAGAAGKQPSETSEPSSTLSKVPAPLVLLDVAASGNRNLKAEDFTVLEDGKAQKLVFFKLQQPASAASATGNPRPLELGPNLFTNAGAAPGMGTRNVIVIDPEESSAQTQARVRAELIKYVRQANLSDPLAVFRYAYGEVEMLQDFTTNRTLLEQALERPMLRLRRPEDSAMLPGEYFISRFVRNSRERQTLEDFFATLAAYPGRKNLIWLAEPPAQGYDLLAENPGFKNPFRVPYRFPTIEALSATVLETQPLVPGKLRPTAMPGAGSGRALMDSDFVLFLVEPEIYVPPEWCGHWTSEEGVLWCEDDQDDPFQRDEMSPEFHRAMNNLAKRTGGRAYQNRHYLNHVIGESIRAGSMYYVLGYYPEKTNKDGVLRNVEVKLNHHGDKLRYRSTYVARPPASYAATTAEGKKKDLERALDLTAPQASSVIFYAQVTPASPQAKNKVAVQYAVRTETLDFRRSDDGLEHASVECAVEAYNDEGTPVRVRSNIYEASLNPAVFKQVSDVGFPCLQTLDLPAGTYLLRLAVRDNQSGSIGTVNAAVRVPPPAADEAPTVNTPATSKEGQF
jgi:hypothetical protein